MKSSTLKLTAAQAEIILDRLELFDAITDVLTDAAPGERAVWSRAEVDAEQREMFAELAPTDWQPGRYRPAPFVVSHPEYSERRNLLRREIIAETMNGSTWYARAEGYGEATPLELANIERSLEAIARKLAQIGIAVDVVTW